MYAVRIKQTVTQEGIAIPFKTVQRFQGKRVEIIIFPEVEPEAESMIKTPTLKEAFAHLFEQYHNVRPYHNIDPSQWEREIRNEW